MNFGASQGSQVKIARTASPKDKADPSAKAHAIKEAKAMYHLGSRVALPLASFADGGFMQLPIIAPGQLDEVATLIRASQRVATDATRIDLMRLRKVLADAGVFGQITVGQVDLWEQPFRFLIDSPADDAHLGGVPQSIALRLDLVLLMGPVNESVTRFTEGHQIVWAIPAGLSGLNMVNIEKRVC